MTWPPPLSGRIDFLDLILFLHLLLYCPLRYVRVSATGSSLTSTSPKSAYALANLCSAAHNPLFLGLCQTYGRSLSNFHSLSYIFRFKHNLLAGLMLPNHLQGIYSMCYKYWKCIYPKRYRVMLKGRVNQITKRHFLNCVVENMFFCNSGDLTF